MFCFSCFFLSFLVRRSSSSLPAVVFIFSFYFSICRFEDNGELYPTAQSRAEQGPVMEFVMI